MKRRRHMRLAELCGCGILVAVIVLSIGLASTRPSRPKREPKPRYCTLAALATPMNLTQVAQLRGDVSERSAAVAALRQWTRLLRQAAPDEIAGAVDILTTISDDYYDMAEAIDFDFAMLAPDARDAYASPAATRALRRYARYLRERCGIDATTSTYSSAAATPAVPEREQQRGYLAPKGLSPNSLHRRMEQP
jgi:hypothetical protein